MMGIKNYLIISENFVGGGLETRICEQIHIFRIRGIRCFLIAKNYNEYYDNMFEDVYTDISFNFTDINALVTLNETINKITKYCENKEIDFIDCHPFNCLLPSVISASRLNIPISYTIHGKASLFYTNKEQPKIKLLNDFCLLFGVDKLVVVCDYLKQEIADCIETDVVANSIGLNKMSNAFLNTRKWAIISRLDMPKSKLVIDSLSCLMDSHIEHIDIIGDGCCSNNVINEIKSDKYKSKVKYIGWVDDILNYLMNHDYDGVIGMGRVVLEAMSLDMPCILLGYGGLAGAIDKDKYSLFSKFNFTYYSNSKKECILKEITDIYNNPNRYKLKEMVNKNNNSSTIWQEYLLSVNNIQRNNKTEIKRVSNLIDSNLIEKLNIKEILEYILCDDVLARYNYVNYFYKNVSL